MGSNVDRIERADGTIRVTYIMQITCILFCEETMGIVLVLSMPAKKTYFGGKKTYFVKREKYFICRCTN